MTYRGLHPSRNIWAMVLAALISIQLSVANADTVKSNPSVFGGPSSVEYQLKSDKKQKAPASNAPLGSAQGLTFGGDINLMAQSANGSGVGTRDAVGGVFRLYGTWTLVGNGTADTGAVHFKVESRHRLGTSIAPQGLGPSIGYAGLTSITFSDAGQILTNLFWQQSFDNNRVAFLAGIVDTTDYVDVYGLGSPWTGFSNLAFSTNPTIPAPNQGLGAAIRWRFGVNYYFTAGIADANGQPDDPVQGIKNLFDTGETFKHVEIGWYDTWANRFSDNFHLSAWQIDARSAAGIGSGWGVAVHGGRTVAERWTPFFRAGYADGGGALVDRSISIGTGYSLFNGRDQLGIGLNWSKAPQGTTSGQSRDQYTAEAFYRYQPLPNVQITPDIQYLANPAFAPGVDSEWVAGLRVRITF